jgi:L-fuculose-phosphate aldolase
MTLEQLKAQLVSTSHKLAFRGWVANHDGNVSVRAGDGRFLATPTAVHKGDVDHTMLVVVDEGGTVLEGSRKIFSEWELHRAIYRARPEVQAVVHAHPPYATACAVAGFLLSAPVMVEPVVSLGAGIPNVPFFMPKDDAGLALLSDAATRADVVIIDNHGPLSWGTSLEQAYLRMELVEHQAKIQTIARSLGGARPLPEGALQSLLDARQKAGLLAPAESPRVIEEPAISQMIARIVAEELAGR